MDNTIPMPKILNISLSWLVWPSMLFVSLLPDILFRELTGSQPGWLYWAKIGLLGILLFASLLWGKLRSLRLFFAVMSAIYLLDLILPKFYERLSYKNWFSGANSFVQEVGSNELIRVTAATILVLVMLVLLRRFDRFFLVKGKLDALAAPIPLIMSRPSSWRVLGPAISVAMCLGLLVFTFAFGSLPSISGLTGVLPLLPFVLLFAVSNSFGEELLYRAPWLAALENPLGPTQALLITAAYFGIGHFYGVPYGILGCIMAFIPGWLMGKAMLETRGFFWAWFIHFWIDFVIFFFMAMGSVRPGG